MFCGAGSCAVAGPPAKYSATQGRKPVRKLSLRADVAALPPKASCCERVHIRATLIKFYTVFVFQVNDYGSVACDECIRLGRRPAVPAPSQHAPHHGPLPPQGGYIASGFAALTVGAVLVGLNKRTASDGFLHGTGFGDCGSGENSI